MYLEAGQIASLRSLCFPVSPVTVHKDFAHVAAGLWLLQNDPGHAQGIWQHHSARTLWMRSSAGAKPEQFPLPNRSYSEVHSDHLKNSPDGVQKLP